MVVPKPQLQLKTSLRKVLTFCIVILSTLFTTCKEQVQSNPNFKKQISGSTLIADTLIYFDLDSLTPYYSSCIQFTNSESVSQIVIFNSVISNIDFYSLGSPDRKKRIELSKLGLNNFKYYDGIHYLNKDSIMLVSSSAGIVTLIDNSGRPIKTYDIHPSDTNNHFSSPTVGSISPLAKNGNKIFINGLFGEAIDPFGVIHPGQVKNLNLKLDLVTGVNTSGVGYPKSYEGNFWGPHMMSYFTAYNPNTKQIVFSFPASHNIVAMTLDGGSNEYLAGSTQFDRIEPMEKDQIPNELRNRYYLSNPSYGAIYYDQFRRLYYRIANQAISEDELESGDIKSTIKPTSILILDEKFNLLGETVLPRFSYTETMAFVTEKGLYLANWEKSQFDESKIYFSRFTLAH